LVAKRTHFWGTFPPKDKFGFSPKLKEDRRA